MSVWGDALLGQTFPGFTRFAAALSVHLVLSALASPAGAITLSQYVTDVVNLNPVVREQVHAYRQVAQDYQIALAGWRPNLDLSSSFGRSSRRAPNTSQRRTDFNSAQFDLMLSQNLFDGFDTTNQIAQARARISSAAYRLYDTADNIALEAIQAYLNVLTEKRLVVLAARNVEAHERILSQIEERNTAGIGRRSDVEQTEGRLAQARGSLVAQQNNLQDALTELHRLLGRYLGPEELLEPEPPRLPEDSIESLTEGAITTHPAIQSAVYNIEASRFDFRRANSSDLPQLNLELQQSVGDNVGGTAGNLNDRSVMLTFRYNLYRGGADRAEQRKRISAMHESEAFLARVRRQVVDTLRLAWTANRALHAQLPFLREHAAKSKETLGLYEEEFLLQRRDLIDVLDAENEWNRALSRETEARYAALAAKFRVYEALGDLFSPLQLNVEISDDDLRIADIRAGGIDSPELPEDRDKDGLPDRRDQCDNTSEGSEVDAYGCRQQSEIELGLQGVGHPPVAMPDTLSTTQDKRLTITRTMLLGNDSDPDGDSFTVSDYTQPVNGSLRRSTRGNLIYTPAAGFTGEDRFRYVLSDDVGRTAQTEVIVRVEPLVPPRPDVPDVALVQFGYKQLTLTGDSQARIDAILDRLVDYPGVRIEVFTYTDNVGSAQYNRRLSDWRAQAMKQMLVNRGFSADRVTATGKGENDPIADNATEEGRAKNRRGEFRFIFPGE